MKKVFSIFVIMALMSLNVIAESVDVNTAKTLGTSFMRNNTKLKFKELTLSYTAFTKYDTPAFYVFSNKGKGFVIVSADDRMRPIIGYSAENSFNPDNINPNLNTFFQNYICSTEYVVDNQLERSQEAKDDWKCLETFGKLSSNKIRSSVAPLVTTTWNQSDLYNSMCPEDPAGFGGHAKSGCVANAMAQIMNYWEWPQTGSGTHSYYSPYGELTVDFGETNYNFELMPDFLDYTTPQAEIDAVALLQYHAGVAVEMNYGPTASGAYSYYVPLAMKYYFKYDTDLYTTYLEHTEGGLPEWENMLRESIDRGEPLYYAAIGPDGGHAFVCSGYDENNLFHFNWGWQGFDNGYYAIDNFYLTYHDFPYAHEALFNMRPVNIYNNKPKTVDNVSYQTDDENLVNTISFNAPTHAINDVILQKIDSIIVLRNDNHLFTFDNPNPGELLSLEDQLDRNGVNYYFIYAYANDFKSTAVIDTVMTGATCDIEINLYDSDNDGWLSPALSILDSRDVLIKKVGLEDGNYETLTVPVPDNDSITFFWNYVNAAYSDEDEECSFEIYHNSNMIYQSEGKPHVGILTQYYVDCQHDNVNDLQNVDEIVICPNPADNFLKISGTDVNSVIIYNSLGQKVVSKSINDNIIDITNLPNGLYMIEISDIKGNIITKKFVKK